LCVLIGIIVYLKIKNKKCNTTIKVWLNKKQKILNTHTIEKLM